MLTLHGFFTLIRVYVDVSDKANVAVVDAVAMKTVAHYDLGDKGNGLAGLALDAKSHVLFVACRNSGIPPAQPAAPMMVVLSADDGRILTTLPLAGAPPGRGNPRGPMLPDSFVILVVGAAK